ncbi:MAG: serine/threonine protein kinase [Myxococcales bacterium]|nr:serine/threonine protein kinase [Myxococcales bacterium]
MDLRSSTATWTGCSGPADQPTRAFARHHGRAHTRPPARPPSEAIGPYRVLALLGEGGMARVYLAEHTVMGRRVAIKRLLPALAQHQTARALFLREARIAGSIRHANLLDVYDFGTDPAGRPYYVMELAAGETLAQRLRRGPLMTSQCLDTAIVLADAAAAIHAAGYVHRDIKAENVVLARHERRLVPKLIDFGIAQALDPEADDPDALAIGMCGTPRTMAPEQVAVDRIDERTDVWALGVLVYEMLCAELPFAGGASVRDDLLAIVADPPRPLPAHADPDVAAIALTCLEKDPADRPASAAALAAALRAVQADHRVRHGLRGRAADGERRHAA